MEWKDTEVQVGIDRDILRPIHKWVLLEDKRIVAEIDCPVLSMHFGYICELFFDLPHRCGYDQYPEPRYVDLPSAKEWCEARWLERCQTDMTREIKACECQ